MSEAGARHRLAAARLWAAQRFPYLATALFASPVVFRPGQGSLTADRSWRLYVDPDRAEEWPVEVLGSLLVVQAHHLLREHADRARGAGVEDDDVDAWSDAADAEINDDLVDLLTLPGDDEIVMPEALGQERGRLAEEYFEAVREERRTRRAPDRGSASHGRPRDTELGEAPAPGEADTDAAEGISPSSAELIRRQTAGEVAAHARQAGTVPAGLARWAEQRLRPRLDWRRVLGVELRRGVTDVQGRVDYSYRRPSRRAGSAPDVVLPSLRKPTPEVAVVCDTSGSMGEARLVRVRAEVDGVLRAVGVNGVRTLATDSAVHDVSRVRRTQQLVLTGGGGTDMGVGIAAAAALRPRPHVVVVLTDGETPWPPAPPRGIRVIVVLLGSRAPAAPSWARAVRVDDDA